MNIIILRYCQKFPEPSRTFLKVLIYFDAYFDQTIGWLVLESSGGFQEFLVDFRKLLNAWY